jgi:histidinol phosphatase-like enzyme
MPSPPLLLFDARDEFGMDLATSFMIDDKLRDLECGWNAGVGISQPVHISYGRKVEREATVTLAQVVIVEDLPGATDWILAQARTP